MDRKKTEIALRMMFFVFFLFYLNAISKLEANEGNIVLLKEREKLLQRWDEVFVEHKIINFNYQNQPLSSFGFLGINSKGDFFLYSRIAERIMQFNNKRYFLRFIGRKGRGPGEYEMIGNAFFDKEGDLYIYDIPTRRISIFSSPNYQFVKQIHPKSGAERIFIEPEGNYITFSLYNVPKLLKKYDRKGNILAEAFKCEDEILRTAMARFNPGGMGDIPDKGFLFIYPDKYYIYYYDYNFGIKKILKPDNFSKFYPKAESFPRNLSPYEYSYEHSKWWNKFIHPDNIYFLKDKYFIVTLVESKGKFGKWYINIHDLDGITYAKGLEVPYDRFVYSHDVYVYVIEEERFIGRDEFAPQLVHRYRFSLLTN